MRRLLPIATSRLFAVLLVGAALSAPAAAQSPAKYVLTDLGTLGGMHSAANDINNLGQVTGTSDTASGSRAYRTAPNRVIKPADNLGTLGGTFSTGERINDAGQVAGSSSNGTNTHAFRSSANNLVITLTDLGTFDGAFSSFGSGIDSLGRVTGSAHVANTAACFFIFSNSAFRTTAGGTMATADNLGTLVPSNCRSAQGWAINDLGVVVGDSATQLSTGIPNHAFRASPGSAMVDIHPAGAYDSSIAVDVNSAGQIVGTVSVGPAFNPTAQHCYRTTPGQSIQLPADSLGNLGAAFCNARGVNADGDVVGTSSTGSAPHAFIYTDGTIYDLNNLIGATTVVLTQATGINDSGQISAQGWTNGLFGGALHSFRLDPFDLATGNFLELLSDTDLELTSGQSNSLIDKFMNALASIEQGANKQAINQLSALVNSVDSWLKSGKVSSETASTLITAANAIIAAL